MEVGAAKHVKSLALVIAVLVSAACPVAADLSAPDFSWGAKCPASVKASLAQAQSKWREAAKVPTSPDWLKSTKHTSFDEAYLREVMGRKDFSYSLLDVGMAKLKCLDECKRVYAKAIASAGTHVPSSARRFNDYYYYLASEIRLAIGLARAEISREMMGKDVSGYCFQAMEAAIDALRDAAADAEKVPGGAKRAERIRKFRTSLFDVWEAAERAKDTSLIGAIELAKAWDAAGLSDQTKS